MPSRWVIHAATMELGGPTSADIIRRATASTLARAEASGAGGRVPAVVEDGRVTRPVAVLLPGAGSSADFVRRAFGPALAGHELVAVPPAPGPSVVSAAFAALDAAAAAYGPRLRLVGGVSLGAHVAARWAGGRTLDGVLLALPAWTGAPGAVAAATGAAADQVDRLGVAGALAAARAGGVGWVADELAAAWPAYGDLLAPTLRAAAAVRGPVGRRAGGARPAGRLVAFADDPLHPLAVAEEWAALLPRAALRRLRLADLAADRAPLGAAARGALTAATSHTRRPPHPRDTAHSHRTHRRLTPHPHRRPAASAHERPRPQHSPAGRDSSASRTYLQSRPRAAQSSVGAAREAVRSRGPPAQAAPSQRLAVAETAGSAAGGGRPQPRADQPSGRADRRRGRAGGSRGRAAAGGRRAEWLSDGGGRRGGGRRAGGAPALGGRSGGSGAGSSSARQRRSGSLGEVGRVVLGRSSGAACAPLACSACSATSLGSTSGSGSRTGIGELPRTTTMLRTASSSTAARAGSVAAAPVNSVRRNHRGPSTPTNRTDWNPPCTGTRPTSSVPNRPLPSCAVPPWVGDRAADLGPDLVPDPGRPRRRERADLRLAPPYDRVAAMTWPVRVDVDAHLDPGHHRDPQRAEVEPLQLVVRAVRLVVRPRGEVGVPLLLGRPRRGRVQLRPLGLAGRADPAPSRLPDGPSRAPTSRACPPVDPCPPAPRADSGSASTGRNTARSTRCSTSWAIRSPRDSRSGCTGSWLMTMTFTSPR